MYFGVPWSVATMMFLVLQQARHSIKTGYGLSKPVYGNLFAGIGQGNGIGPALWCLISTIIIKMCKRRGHGTTITTTMSRTEVSLLGFAFVDDADLVSATNNVHTTGKEMIAKMQALMTDWCGGIRATGGLIAAAKTRWFLLSSYWDGLDWQYHTKESIPGNISLPDKDGRVHTVSRKEPSASFDSLGVRTNLCGTFEPALEDVTKVSQVFSTQMNNAKCD